MILEGANHRRFIVDLWPEPFPSHPICCTCFGWWSWACDNLKAQANLATPYSGWAIVLCVLHQKSPMHQFLGGVLRVVRAPCTKFVQDSPQAA